MLLGGASSAAFAQAPANVTLENVIIKGGDGATVTIAKIDATGTNLTRDELASLFDAATPRDVATAIAAKMKADRLAIPQATVKTRMFYARKKLSEQLQAAGIDRGWP